MKPLVLHMRACNFFGGPERQIIGHVKHSHHFNHKILSFSDNGRRDDLADKCLQEDIAFEKVTSKSAYDPSSVFELRRILKDSRPAVICSHGYRTTILSLLAKSGMSIPLIVFSRGHTGENGKVKLFEAIERKAIAFSDGVVAVSNGYADYLRQTGVTAKPIRVVQNAVDADRLSAHMPKADKKRSELGFRKGDILIATAGRISPEKAQEVLIEAFARIKGEHPKASLLIIGDGPSRRALEGLARERNAEGVRFLGFRTDMDQIMCAIDLFVLPSLTEGLPNVILEAFACKKPVVATAVGGVPEIVDHGKSGLLVPPKRPDLLAEAIQALLRDPERRRAMGEAGYERVRRDFTFEAQAGKLEGIYEEIIDGSLRLRR